MRSRVPATVTVASTTSATPTAVASIPASVEPEDEYIADVSVVLVGLTMANTQAPGSAAQVHIGILRSGATAWDGELVSKYLDGGETFSWAGRVRLDAGDSIESWASVTNYIDVTVETELN